MKKLGGIKKTTKKVVKKSKDKNIELDLDKNTLLWLAIEAHEKDITLNELVNRLVKEFIEKTKDMPKEEVAKLLNL